VSLLLPAGVLCISSHSPLDLFAYPAYAVKLNPASPISNSTAEAILAGNAFTSDRNENDDDNEEETRNDELQIQQEQRKKIDISGLHDDSEHSEHDQQLKGPSKPYLLRSSSNGQAYLCTVPQLSQSSTPHSNPSTHEMAKSSIKKHKQQPHTSATEAEKEQTRQKNEHEKKEAFERGLALLEPLKGSCLYTTQGWFTCKSYH